MKASQVRAIAKRMSAATPDAKAAASKLYDAIKDKLDEALTEYMVRMGCRRLIYCARHKALNQLKRYLPTAPRVATNRKVSSDYSRRVAAIVGRKEKWLDEWTLPNGKCLGDATGTECMEVAENMTADANGMLVHAAYLRSVGQIAGDRVVRLVFTHKKARALWDGIKGNVAAA